MTSKKAAGKGLPAARSLPTPREFRDDSQPHSHPLPGAWNRPEPYVAGPRLRDVVNTALYLRRPLLLEGEPGTGKTRLAHAVAYELGYPLQEIYVRSSTRAQELLWTFDAVLRLYDVQKSKSGTLPPDDTYVRYGPLGDAIRLAERNIPSVVLIDEIDKADLDFPNDLLLELDRLRFSVTEVPSLRFDALKGLTREARRDALPLVLITSNREKELPAPFLRRCLFYYIPFPEQPTDLEPILAVHYNKKITPLFVAAIQKYWALRDGGRFSLRKKPSTSELLDWVTALERDERDQRLTARKLADTPLAELPYLEALLKTQVDEDEFRSKAAREAAPQAGAAGT